MIEKLDEVLIKWFGEVIFHTTCPKNEFVDDLKQIRNIPREMSYRIFQNLIGVLCLTSTILVLPHFQIL